MCNPKEQIKCSRELLMNAAGVQFLRREDQRALQREINWDEHQTETSKDKPIEAFNKPEAN